MLQDFKAFIMRGNVLDLAVAVVIGAAFGKIVNSFVKDILMPPIGLALGKVDFSNLYINLTGEEFPSLAAAQEAGAPTINYGVFTNTLLDFLIVAFAIFVVIKLFEAAKRKEEEPPAEPDEKNCPHCCSAIPKAATRCAHCTSELTAA